jgi:hypothetical protein
MDVVVSFMLQALSQPGNKKKRHCWREDRVGPRAGIGMLAKRKIPVPDWD